MGVIELALVLVSSVGGGAVLAVGIALVRRGGSPPPRATRLDRAWPRVLVGGGLAGLGLCLGAALAHSIVVPAAIARFAELEPDLYLRPAQVTSATVAAMVVLGLAGACGPVAWLLSAGSRRAVRRTLLATTAMPATALLIAALATPPDVITQLLAALVLGLPWLLGLAAGAATVLVVGRRRADHGPDEL